MQVKRQQSEPDMEQQTGSKLGKEYVKAIYFHPTLLTYTQSGIICISEVVDISPGNLDSSL